jgi:hypothetical protein
MHFKIVTKNNCNLYAIVEIESLTPVGVLQIFRVKILRGMSVVSPFTHFSTLVIFLLILLSPSVFKKGEGEG